MTEIYKHETNEDLNLKLRKDNKEWEKYNKRMDNIIENVEIESEIEAENKFRSKNSKLFTISIIGLTILILIFFKAERYSTLQKELIKKPQLIEIANPSQNKSQKLLQKNHLPPRPAELSKTQSKESVLVDNIPSKQNKKPITKFSKVNNLSKVVIEKKNHPR